MFAYCQNSPVINEDKLGQRMMSSLDIEIGGDAYSDADLVILDNTEEIIEAAKTYNIDPYVLAACIHTEQSINYDMMDVLIDVPLFWMDTSVGISQVRISTVKLLEDNGYIDRIDTGLIAELEIANHLSNDNAYNVNCAAAYLSFIQTQWADNYDVSKNPAVWGTLYNQGNIRPPHPNPGPNNFGEKVAAKYWYMEMLLH